MINIVIIEDENPAVEKLKHLLAKTGENITIIKILGSVEESVNWLNLNPSPDLIFMDIQLSDGLSFEIFESINIAAPIIFTTAYDNYAIKAFKVNSIDYLLKPIDSELLINALQKYKEHYMNRTSEQISKMISQIPVSYKNRFLIKTGEHFRSVAVSDIESFFIQERSTFFVTKESKILDIDYSLDQLEKIVNPDIFFRTNRNYLINIQYIKDMIGYSGSRIKLKMLYGTYPEPVIISRDRVNAFKQRMDR
ncbi:MAG: LytTR family DNA-binding domain-containing protein [Mariniphaga sp.]